MEKLGGKDTSYPESMIGKEDKVIIEEAKKRKEEMEACFAALEEKREENKIYYFKKSLRNLVKFFKNLIICITCCETLGAQELYEKETAELGEEISLFRKELENQDEMFLENFFDDEATTQKEINKLKEKFDKLTEKTKGIHFQEDLEEMGEILNDMLYYL